MNLLRQDLTKFTMKGKKKNNMEVQICSNLITDCNNKAK